ncbi:MAG: glycosyltransferase family 2 protein [Duncaniella sp.]|nr:glycosyltransferase family 2 protein [Duncaniella sp.]
MELSVIVLTCNQRAYTLRLFETLAPYLRQYPSTELILIDNASTDDTIEAVRAMALPHHQIDIIRNERNLGVAAARNIGLQRAKGDFLLILDNDTEVTPHAIRGLIDYMNSNPDCGVSAPALRSPDGDLQMSAKPFPGLGIKVNHLIRRGVVSASEINAMQSPHPLYVIGACQMIRRSALETVGLLDERIFYGPEDADFCMRVAASGFTIDYVPSLSIVHHWQRATSRSPFSRLSLLHFLALIYFYIKHRRLL